MNAPAARAITHRRILAIALPIVLSNATVPLLGVVDTGVIGQLGDPVPIGAVGIGAVIISAIYWIFGFLRMGTTGMTSQALGAEDQGEADALLSRALIIGVACGLAVIVLQPLIFAAAFQLSPASAEVESLARDYLQVRVWSAPAAIALYGITGWLIAAERTKAVLVLQVWMNGLNILLSFAFVIGLAWGVTGVALSSFIAEWAGLAVGLWFCRGACARPFWREWPRVLDRTRLLAMAAVNGDIFLRSLFLQAIFVSFLFFGADFGDVPLAANQILLQFLYVTSYALDGFAFGAETLVGNAMGAKDRARLRRAAVLNSVWAGGIMVIFAVGVALFGAGVIDLMTTSEEVRAVAKVYLPWMIAAPVIGVACWMLDGIFIGATRTADMRNMMAISTAFYFAAVWVLAPAFENHGLWAALILSFVARGVTLGLRYPALERATEV
ncbi:MAG: MATE family efflux transporter [Silicimonas sp.]|nr:MATE family efflux transporter [Silicimonas sp.]